MSQDNVPPAPAEAGAEKCPSLPTISFSTSNSSTFGSIPPELPYNEKDNMNVHANMQPQLYRVHQELEMQAAKLQQTGKSMFALVTAFSIAIIAPPLLIAVCSSNRGVIVAMFSSSAILCLIIVSIYAWLTYRFRATPAIQARSIRCLLYLYSSIYISLFGNFVVTMATVVDHLFDLSKNSYYSEVRIYLIVSIPIVIMSDAFFFGCICGRLRLLYHLFVGPVKCYSVTDMYWILHTPMIWLGFAGVLCSLFPIVYWSYAYAHSDYSFIYFGYFAISLTAMCVLGYYTWKTRNVSSHFCDWNQNVRTVFIYLLFSTTLIIIVKGTKISPVEQSVILQMGHQMSLMIFILDSFTATFYHLCISEVAMLEHPATMPAKPKWIRMLRCAFYLD